MTASQRSQVRVQMPMPGGGIGQLGGPELRSLAPRLFILEVHGGRASREVRNLHRRPAVEGGLFGKNARVVGDTAAGSVRGLEVVCRKQTRSEGGVVLVVSPQRWQSYLLRYWCGR